MTTNANGTSEPSYRPSFLRSDENVAESVRRVLSTAYALLESAEKVVSQNGDRFGQMLSAAIFYANMDLSALTRWLDEARFYGDSVHIRESALPQSETYSTVHDSEEYRQLRAAVYMVYEHLETGNGQAGRDISSLLLSASEKFGDFLRGANETKPKPVEL